MIDSRFACYNLLYLPLCCDSYMCFLCWRVLSSSWMLFLFFCSFLSTSIWVFFLLSSLTRFHYLVAPNLSNGEGIRITIVKYLIFPPSQCDACTFKKNIMQIMCKNLLCEYILHIFCYFIQHNFKEFK